jgi:hypothetical protein
MKLIKSFFFTTALLAVPGLAYTATPSADLSVTVVPSAPHSACLVGSICPPGVAWTNVFDEEMSKGYLSSLFKAVSGDGMGCTCYSDGVHGWSFPGDGTLTMNGWPAESISPTGKHGGITFGTTQVYNTPGYYEIKASAGSDWNGWFSLAGNYNCPSTNVPVEVDFFENTFGHGNVESNMNTGCGGTNISHLGTDITGVHVYGVDISTTRGLTSYIDGVAKGNIPYSSIPAGGICTNAAVCGTGLWLQAGGPGGDAVPMKVYWMRYYTGVPQ